MAEKENCLKELDEVNKELKFLAFSLKLILCPPFL